MIAASRVKYSKILAACGVAGAVVAVQIGKKLTRRRVELHLGPRWHGQRPGNGRIQKRDACSVGSEAEGGEGSRAGIACCVAVEQAKVVSLLVGKISGVWVSNTGLQGDQIGGGAVW